MATRNRSTRTKPEATEAEATEAEATPATDVATVTPAEAVAVPAEIYPASTGSVVDDMIADRDAGRTLRTWTLAEAEAEASLLAVAEATHETHKAVWAYGLHRSDLVMERGLSGKAKAEATARGQRSQAAWGELAGITGEYIGQGRVLGAAIVEFGWMPGSAEYKHLRTVRSVEAVTAAFSAVASAPEGQAHAEAIESAKAIVAKAEPKKRAPGGVTNQTETAPAVSGNVAPWLGFHAEVRSLTARLTAADGKATRHELDALTEAVALLAEAVETVESRGVRAGSASDGTTVNGVNTEAPAEAVG